jgi:cell division septal protein FtsQ
MTEVPSVDVLIAEQRAKKQAIKRYKLKRLFISLIVLLLLAGSCYGVIRFDHFNLKRIDVTGNRILKTEYLQELLWSQVQRKVGLTSGLQLSSRINDETLIASYSIRYPRFNEILVSIHEHRILAHLIDQNLILLENNQVVDLDASTMSYPIGVPLISGYADEIAYERLADALLTLSVENLMNISELKREPKSYDAYYAHLRMMDGIQVYTALSSLHVLNDYLKIRNALNPEHDCIAIDEITAVPYSFSCAS